MNAPARIASVLSGAALGFGLILGAAPAAQANGGHHSSFRHERSGAEARSWSQGKSQSDPDGDSNGGMDKPGHQGGFDDDRDGNNGCGNDNDREDDNNGRCGRHRELSAAEIQTRRERFAQVKAAWLAALERCRDKAVDDDDLDDIDVEGAAEEAEKCNCDKAIDVLATAGVVTPAATKVEAAVTVTPAPAATAAAPATTVAGTVETAADTSTPTPAPTPTAAPTTSTPVPTEVMGISETAPDTLARTGAGLGILALAGGLCLGGGRLLDLARRRLGS